MNVTPTAVTNTANLSLFIVNMAYRLRADFRQRAPDYSILDLKADCRGYKYVEEMITDNHIEGSSIERYSSLHRRYDNGLPSPMRRRKYHYTAVLICMQITVWSCYAMNRSR